ALTWAGARIVGALEGRGVQGTTDTGPLGVGNELVYTPLLQNQVWRLRAVSLTYAANATVADRRPRLFFTQFGIDSGLLSSPQDITANQTVVTTWAPGASLTAGSPLRDGMAPLPPEG